MCRIFNRFTTIFESLRLVGESRFVYMNNFISHFLALNIYQSRVIEWVVNADLNLIFVCVCVSCAMFEYLFVEIMLNFEFGKWLRRWC